MTMPRKKVSTYQPPPTVEQLETWATPRLLRFYKIKWKQCMRSAPVYDEIPTEWFLKFYEYVRQIKCILNRREHVKS